MCPAPEDEFAPVERRTAFALGDKPGAGLAFKLGEDFKFLVRVDQPAKDRRLVTGLRDQPHQAAIIEGGKFQTPPRRAST